MSIYKYIDDYGMYTFSEKRFNEVDAAIFSFLSYADLGDIFDDRNKSTIYEAARKYVGLFDEKKNNINIVAVREANKLLRYIKDVKRYKDCHIYNYEYVGNEDVQFGALTFEYQENKLFVAFEGTDSLFSGWKENFILSYQYPTISHKMAIKYLNKHFLFSFKELIIGGHSKGGNLALVAAMNCNPILRVRIKKIYNIDGPGLLDNEFNSLRYDLIKDRYTHLMPDYSVIGLFLNHSKDVVVESSDKGILAHSIINWEVYGTHFKRIELSKFSSELDSEIKVWFNKYNTEDKKQFTKNFDDIIKKANITSILDLKTKNKNIMSLIYESKNMSDSTKKMLGDFIKIIIKCLTDVKKEELKQFLSNFFKLKEKQNGIK